MHDNLHPCTATDANEASETAYWRLLSCPWEPLFVADWNRAVFVHYEVDPRALQRDVPFPLDLREGRAYVSLVAFTMRGMRLRFGGSAGALLLKPIATHQFLNVRTYVRNRGEPGIYFLGEWLSSRLSVNLGPTTFGLPYRLGRMRYQNDHSVGDVEGEVVDSTGRFRFAYEAKVGMETRFHTCRAGSLDEFLLERYTAFTSQSDSRRFFRIWHSPWRQAPLEVTVRDTSLTSERWPWFADAMQVGGTYSPGANGVWMGWPHRIREMETKSQRRVLSAAFEIP